MADTSAQGRETNYEAPAIRRLGRIADLTQSGTTGNSDGGGFAGGSGSAQ